MMCLPLIWMFLNSILSILIYMYLLIRLSGIWRKLPFCVFLQIMIFITLRTIIFLKTYIFFIIYYLYLCLFLYLYLFFIFIFRFILKSFYCMKIVYLFSDLFFLLIYACFIYAMDLLSLILQFLAGSRKLFITIKPKNRWLLILFDILIVFWKYWFCYDNWCWMTLFFRTWIYLCRFWRLTCKIFFVRFKSICLRWEHFMASLQIKFIWCW